MQEDNIPRKDFSLTEMDLFDRMAVAKEQSRWRLSSDKGPCQSGVQYCSQEWSALSGKKLRLVHVERKAQGLKEGLAKLSVWMVDRTTAL